MELTDKQKAELDAIKSLPDDQIDTSDAPEILDWSKARRGLLYRAQTQKVVLKLDQYVVDWFKTNSPHDHDPSELINRVLLDFIWDRKRRPLKATSDTPKEGQNDDHSQTTA